MVHVLSVVDQGDGSLLWTFDSEILVVDDLNPLEASVDGIGWITQSGAAQTSPFTMQIYYFHAALTLWRINGEPNILFALGVDLADGTTGAVT